MEMPLSRRQPKIRWPEFDAIVERRALAAMHAADIGVPPGRETDRFERALAGWLGVPRTFAVANGTCALETALAALGIGPGDEVICTSYSFIASSFAILHVGAQCVFCDVGADHILDVRKAAKLITARTKAILVVHLYGIVADMDPILQFARRHSLKVIEDCAQCLGGVYKDRKVGTIGDVGCFSFCQSKHITTGGEGGMVVARDPAVAERVAAYRDERDYRLGDLQSAIGLAMFERLECWNLPRRRMFARVLIEELGNHPLVKSVPPDTPERQNAFWLVPFVLRTERLKVPGLEFVRSVQERGVGAYAILWPEMYREEAFVARRGLGSENAPFGDRRSRFIDYSKVICPVAHGMTESVIGFWPHPTYSLGDIHDDIRAFNEVAAAMG